MGEMSVLVAVLELPPLPFGFLANPSYFSLVTSASHAIHRNIGPDRGEWSTPDRFPCAVYVGDGIFAEEDFGANRKFPRKEERKKEVHIHRAEFRVDSPGREEGRKERRKDSLMKLFM